MRSRFLRHSFGPFDFSPQLRGTHSASPRVSSLLLGFSIAAGALLVAPQAPLAWAAPTLGGDENGPKVQIISPAYQDVLKGRTRILVGVKATQFNPASIQLFLDGKADTEVLSLTSLASSSFNWDTRKLTDGPHKLLVRVTDTQGFVGLSEVNVYVNNSNTRDTTAPDLKWGNVAPYQQLSGQAAIALEAKDNFGVKWIIVSLNPLDKAKQQPAERSWLLSRPPYTFNLDTTKVADGLYAISARAWDSMEQEGQSKTLTVGVVNSPVNATTIGESLEGLKAMEQAQNKNAAPNSTQAKPPKTNFVPPTPPASTDSHSGNSATSKTTPGSASVKVPDDYTFIPDTAPSQKGAKVEIARTTPPVGSPVLSAGTTSRKGVASAPALTSPEASSDTTGTRVARLSQPETKPRTGADSAFATLSSHDGSTDVLAPSLSSATQLEAPSASTPTSDPIRIARANLPEIAPRHQGLGAELSTRMPDLTAPVAVAVAPETVAATQTHVELARLAAPAPVRPVRIAPVLSAPKNSVAGVLAGTQKLSPAIATSPALVASSAARKRNADRVSGMSKVKLSNPQQREASRPAKTTTGAAKTEIAAIPRTSGPIQVVPDAAITMEHPSITVSPIKAAFNSSLPAFHRVRTATSLRSIATHYALPLELVAAANNWTTDMNVLPGMVVQLPRQVQLSVNGQVIQGDVASLVAGDTSFTAMRFLFEHTGGKITWDALTQEAVATKGGSTIRVKVGSKFASVNNKKVMMQLAAFLFEGRTMVPSRFFEEGLNAQVEWDPRTGHMVVAMAG